MFGSFSFLIIIVFLSGILIYNYAIYPLFVSPLAKIPNAHPTAPLSSAWILWVRYMGRENRTIQAAHEKHGPIVQLSPNEISVNDYEHALKPVYAGGFEKHEWYRVQFDNYGVHNMFSTITARPHSARKRMLSNIYSKSFIQSSPTMTAASRTIMFERFLPKLHTLMSASNGGDTKSGSVDVYALCNAAMMDLVTAYIFGLDSSSSHLTDDAEARWWLRLYNDRREYTFWTSELPHLTRFMKRLRIWLYPRWVDASNRQIEKWVVAMCDAAEERLQANTAAATERPQNVPVVYTQLRAALTQTNAKELDGTPLAVSDPEERRLAIASETLDHLAAGHETSAITLTYLFHELARNQHVQDRLRAELDTLSTPLRNPPAGSPVPNGKELDNLPFLQAVIQETLRRHAAIPGQQPRITPDTTASSAEPGVIIGDYHIPPNVRIGAQAYSLHRITSVFPEPEVWRPERWLFEESESGEKDTSGVRDVSRKTEMNRHFWAFGSGGRMCIGSNLAIHNMKLVIALAVANYRFELTEDGPETLVQKDGYTCPPIAAECMLKTTKI